MADPSLRPLRLRAVQLLDSITARLMTTHFHAISLAVRDAAGEALGLGKDSITVIPRGRDRERLGFPDSSRRRLARQRLGIDADAEVVLNVARQEYQKGQRYLIEAAASLVRSREKLQVLIAGREGHATAELRALADRLVLEGRLRFLGHRDDVPDLLAAADVFVFPSLYEGLGGALIEAMALGVPIVASRLPAIEEVLDGGAAGVTVEPASAPALAAAVAELLDDPTRRGLIARRGAEIFEERYTIGRSARSMLELYAQLMDRPETSG